MTPHTDEILMMWPPPPFFMCGIAARMDRLAGGAAPDQARAILAGGRRLIDADAMGPLFKVLALAAPALPAPAGFEP